jgi:signal transduction histidine kinase
VRWLAILVALWVGSFAALAQSAAATDAGIDVRFLRAEFVPSDGPAPPDAGWTALDLPHAWRSTHPKLDGFGWYRMRFELAAAPQQTLGLLVERVAVTGEFRINGSLLNPGVRFVGADGRAGTQMTNFSLLLTVPPALLRPGSNELLVRVQGDPLTFGDLAPLRLAPYETLRGDFRQREIRQRIVPQVLLTLTGATLAFALIVWWRERKVSHLRFLAVMAFWSAFVGLYLTPEPPMTRLALALTYALVFIGFNWALLDLLWRFSGSRGRWYPLALNGSAVAMLTVVAVVAAGAIDPTALHVLGLPVIVLRGLAFAMLLAWAWRARQWRAYALTAAELTWFAGAAQVALMLAGILPPDIPRIGAWEGLPMFAVLLFFFVERFVLDHEEAARARQAAIDAERRRILNDMHDGLGSHLIAASRLVQREEIDRALVARTLDDAMLDLRLVIDSLDIDDSDLLPLLANLRYRLTPRLSALGIHLAWHVDATRLPVGSLTPQSALHLLRIVQEAISNAVRHASASVVTLSAAVDRRGTLITVRDDGRGFDSLAHAAVGRGLRGMRARAEGIGAVLEVDAAPGRGAAIALRLPGGPTDRHANTESS